MEFQILDNNMLLIRVPLDAKGRRSASGKSWVNATTGGAVPVPGTDMVVVMTVYTKR